VRSAWGLEIERDVNWRQFAACGPETADWFWIVGRPGPTQLTLDNREALRLCQTCPVITNCVRHEQGHRAQYPHIAGGLLWTTDGPQRVLLSSSAHRRKAGAVPAGTPSRPINAKEQG